MSKCIYCDGTGYVDCSFCNGRGGKWWVKGNNKQWVACTPCKGTGQVKCKKCK